MRTRTPLRADSRVPRRAFTLIELLVVISIIATLMSLLLPAIMNAKRSGTRVQCLSNMRQVGVAAIANATKNGGEIPADGQFVPIPPPVNSDPGNTECGNVGGDAGVNRVVTCLSELDRQDIFDRLDQSVSVVSRANLPLGQLHLNVLVCTADTSAANQPRALSYVINAGYTNRAVLDAYTTAIQAGNLPVQTKVRAHDISQFNWDGNSNTPGVADPDYLDPDDALITRTTGMSWLEVNGENYSQSLNSIYDGADNTLFFTENINAGWAGTWSNPTVSNCAFVYAIDPATATAVNYRSPTELSGYEGTPNALKDAGEGTPSPSSEHAGGVNVLMASGSARFLSDSIDQSVYARLMTPNGGRQRGTIAGFQAQDPLDGSF